MDVDSFSRIGKVLIDLQQVSLEDAHERRAACRVDLVCGPEVEHSRTLQAAVATALRTAGRCYPGAVDLVASPGVRRALQQVSSVELPGSSVAQQPSRYTIAFGRSKCGPEAVQVSFDGWTAQVAPGSESRLPEHEGNPLAGVLAGALAVSETFLHFTGVIPDATHRRIALSLWQPGIRAPIRGPALEYLPSRAWLVGLGHLGQAYAWAFAWLPLAANAERPELWLVDDDKLVDANLETGILSESNHLGAYKTRIVSAWLEARGVRTRIIEHKLGIGFRLDPDEPQLILGGVDRNSVRHVLASAGGRLVDVGLGATATNFDTIAVRAWPNPRRADELWPVNPVGAPVAERLAEHNPAYAALASDRCGRVLLAERAVGVPFVGAAAAAFVWAQVLRELHGGEHVTDLKLKLASPRDLEAFGRPSVAGDLTSVAFLRAQDTWPDGGGQSTVSSLSEA